MELLLGQSNTQTFLLQLIVSYLKLEERGKVKVVALSNFALKAVESGKLAVQIPSLITEKGETITETFLIAQYLLSLQPLWNEFFLGKTEQQIRQIANIQTLFKEGKELRKSIQKYLQSRTFFVGNHLTFADFYMFTKLYDNIVEMTDEQKSQYNNLFRWYKHIQNLPQVTVFLRSQNRLFVSNPALKLSFLETKSKKSEKSKDKSKEVKE